MWGIRSNELVRSIDEVLLNQVGQISLKCSWRVKRKFVFVCKQTASLRLDNNNDVCNWNDRLCFYCCLIFENFDPYDQFDAFWLDNSRKNLTHQN